jgi:shikimate kinase
MLKRRPAISVTSAGGRISRPAAILLVGFMGAGKTSVGQALAQRLGCEFIDLDRRVETAAGQSIRDLFARAGEREFRRLERSMLISGLQATSVQHPSVIAAGGGTFVQRGIPQVLRDAGALAIFLDGDVDELWKRCSADGNGRPLAMDQNQFRQLYAARRPRYMKADIRVCTSGKTVRKIVDELCVRLGHPSPGGEI